MKNHGHVYLIVRVVIFILTTGMSTLHAAASHCHHVGGGVIGIDVSTQSLSLPSTGIGSVTYTFTNNTSSSSFQVLPLTPVLTGINAAITITNNCNTVLAPMGTCTQIVDLTTTNAVADSRGELTIQICDTTKRFCSKSASPCNQVGINIAASAPMTSLSASLSDLALSTSGTAGIPRVITITNSGAAAAENVTVTPAGLPAGSTVSATTCGSTLAAGSTCTVTITPGANATSTCTTGIAPTAGSITVSATNVTTPAITNIYVLGYGCIYEGGYVFSFDNTTPNTASVGGEVVQLINEATAVNWNDTTVVPSAVDANILGIYETSINPPDACNGKSDGQCNTDQIHAYYTVTVPVSPSSYVAGLCTSSTQNGFSGWFLPAICQLGYGVAGCGTSGSPFMPNIQSNLVDNGNIGGLSSVGAERYWSSTEDSVSPTSRAWMQHFQTGGASTQIVNNKSDIPPQAFLYLRCIRSF